MAKKKITLNDKPLSKRDTLILAKEKGIFHALYSEQLTEKAEGKIITLSHVYELQDGNYLYIRNVNDSYGGKGDIFPKVYFEKFVQRMKRFEEDSMNGRTSNIGHWMFYSKNKSELIQLIPKLIRDLAEFFSVDESEMNFSTKSLDTLSKLVKEVNVEKVFENIYDNLIAYLGETFRNNLKMESNWMLEPHFGFPVISSNEENIFYSPIGVVWEELVISDEFDLRKGYGKESRRVGSLLSTEKMFKNLRLRNGS